MKVFCLLLMVLLFQGQAVAEIPALERSLGPRQLLEKFAELRPDDNLASSGARLQVRSAVTDSRLGGEVLARIDRSFETLVATLKEPKNWCDIISLNLNVKSCIILPEQADKQIRIHIYAGRKSYQPPESAFLLEYLFQVEQKEEDYLRVSLKATDGPIGTKDYLFLLETARINDQVAARLVAGHRPSVRSRLATHAYLATLGRKKVGFTTQGKNLDGSLLYVDGFAGMIERNAMRYYLALEAFQETSHLPQEVRFEARIKAWYDLTERYPQQLYEMERVEYLSAKRRERQNQLRLQGQLQDATD